METTDSSQLGTYIKDRLIAFNVPTDSKIISEHFILPREKKWKNCNNRELDLCSSMGKKNNFPMMLFICCDVVLSFFDQEKCKIWDR